MGVSIKVAADVQKIGTRTFREVGALAFGGCELEAVWLFGGEARLIDDR